MNWTYMHSVWALAFSPRKQRLGAQTLCIVITMMFAAPALANTDAPVLAPLEDSASCTSRNELLESVQRQAADAAVTRYLLSEILRSLDELKKRPVPATPPLAPKSLPNPPSVQEGR